MGSLSDISKHRSKVQERIVASLAHYPREQAMHIILSWFSIESLEDAAPTLSGDPSILKDAGE